MISFSRVVGASIPTGDLPSQISHIWVLTMSKNSQEIELSVVIPVFNAENTIRELMTELHSSLLELNRSFEIIFVNDGSSDESWNALCEVHEAHKECVIVIDLAKNFGQHNAIMCGFKACNGKYIVTMDDDLQNPPSEISVLLESLESQSLDLVYGRYQMKKHRLWRNFGSGLTQHFYRHIFARKNGVSAFRILRSELVKNILTYNRNFTYLDGLFAWHTDRIGEVTVRHNARRKGASGYSARKLIVLAINLFTNFSLLPLQVVSTLGIVASFSGFLTGAFFLFQALLHNISVPGYASTIVAILIIGGVQLLSLGMLGEYLGRVHLNINAKPQYVTREARSKIRTE
jgi:undecaprenyl-phosphate 4-deoxy-4-formamido-L-arabinose transferase